VVWLVHARGEQLAAEVISQHFQTLQLIRGKTNGHVTGLLQKQTVVVAKW
jgi:hypothetical protein